MIAFLHSPPLITIDERLEECVHVKFILCLASTGVPVVTFFVSTTMTSHHYYYSTGNHLLLHSQYFLRYRLRDTTTDLLPCVLPKIKVTATSYSTSCGVQGRSCDIHSDTPKYQHPINNDIVTSSDAFCFAHIIYSPSIHQLYTLAVVYT